MADGTKRTPRYHYWHAQVGLSVPSVKVQINPLCWGFGAGFGRGKVALSIGPLAIAVWWKVGAWKCDVARGWTYDAG